MNWLAPLIRRYSVDPAALRIESNDSAALVVEENQRVAKRKALGMKLGRDATDTLSPPINGALTSSQWVPRRGRAQVAQTLGGG